VARHKDRDSRILQTLGEWKQKEGSLPQFIELYSKLLRLQTGVKSRLAVPKPGLTDKTIADQLKQGLPLLRFDDLSLDWSLVQEQLRAVTDVLGEQLTPELGNAEALRSLASIHPHCIKLSGIGIRGCHYQLWPQNRVSMRASSLLLFKPLFDPSWWLTLRRYCPW